MMVLAHCVMVAGLIDLKTFFGSGYLRFTDTFVYIYVLMCFPGYHDNGFVATQHLDTWNDMLYIYIYIYIYVCI